MRALNYILIGLCFASLILGIYIGHGIGYAKRVVEEMQEWQGEERRR